jgi:hypothetical protein
MKCNKPMKNVLILGDSYSTFAGYVPEGYEIYYSHAEKAETDVRNVEETWWHRLSAEMDLNIVLNESWAGTTLCHTGYKGDCSKTSSFIYRLEKLIAENFFEKNDIDTVFVFGCTNDSWANSPLGEIKLGDYQADDLFFVCPAIGYLVSRLKEIMPDGNIVFIINTNIKAEIKEAVKAVSDHNGTTYVELSRIDKLCGHPTVKGMREITEQVKAVLLS